VRTPQGFIFIFIHVRAVARVFAEPSAMASRIASGFGDRVVCGQEGVCALGRLRVY
jgi:hypothetical protein